MPVYPLTKPVTGDPRTAPVRETSIIGAMADSLNLLFLVDDEFTPAIASMGNSANSDFWGATAVIPINVQHTFGQGGVDVENRTQFFGILGRYEGPAVDDSAEAGSSGVVLNGPFTQTMPAVGFEGDALVQDGVTLNSNAIGLVGAVDVQGTGSATNGMGLYIAYVRARDAASTLTNAYGVYVETLTTGGSGTVTNKWAFYGKQRVQTEDSLLVGVAGANAFSGRVFVVGAASSSATTVAIAAGSSQTGALQAWRDASNNDLMVIGVDGIPKWTAAANQQTTVGAAGGASALPAMPTTYLKVKDSAGTTLVIPAYAAS